MEGQRLEGKCWVVPRGSKTIFSAVRAQPWIDDGRLYLNTVDTVDLRSSWTKSSLGMVRFKTLEGKRNRGKGPFLYLYNPKLVLLSLWFALVKVGRARRLSKYLNSFFEQSA